MPSSADVSVQLRYAGRFIRRLAGVGPLWRVQGQLTEELKRGSRGDASGRFEHLHGVPLDVILIDGLEAGLGRSQILAAEG